MRTKILNVLCVLLCILSVFGCYGVSAQSDNNVGLELVFDRDLYVPGDIAVATVYLTGLTDEVSDNKSIGLFETHLTFDTSELDFVPVGEDRFDSGVESQWFVDLCGVNDANVFQVTDNYDDVIVLAFDKETSFVPECDQDGKFAVAQIAFEVYGASDGLITLDFDDAYTNVVAVSKVNDQPFNEYNCTTSDAAEADVDDFLIADTTAYIDESGNITDTIEVGSAYDTAFLIVKLYDAETGMLAAPVRMVEFESRSSIEEETIFTGIPTDGTYKIEYYLWDSGVNGIMGLKPLAQKVTVDVVAQ